MTMHGPLNVKDQPVNGHYTN